MTSNSTVGKLRTDVRSKLVRFQISPRAFNRLFDDSDDRKFSNILDTDDNGGKHPEPTKDEVYSRLWAEGALEICVDVYTGNDNGQATSNRMFYSVRAKDLFTVKPYAISKETWGSTMFKWYVTWQYKMSKRDETTLAPKWYYPDKSPYLPTWDLLVNSGYTVIVSEIDSGKVNKVSKTINTRRSNTESVKAGVEAGLADNITAKLELGWTGSQEKSTSTVVTLEWSEKDDDMGQFQILYSDKYIRRYSSSTKKYNVASYTTGDYFTCTILPLKY